MRNEMDDETMEPEKANGETDKPSPIKSIVVAGVTIPFDTTKPFILVTFGEKGVNDINVSTQECSPYMLWGAAKMIDRYGSDLWTDNRMGQIMAAQVEAAEEAARKGGGIVPVRAMPQDHLSKRGRN